MTAAIVDASCSAISRSRSSASSAPCAGWPIDQALRAGSCVWRRWSTPASSAVVGQRHLQRRLDRLRARVRVENLGHAGRRQRDEALGELERLRVTHLERRREVQLPRLAADRLGDLRSRVAGVDAPQACGTVEDLAPFGGPEVHAAGAREHARRLLELAVRRERHPVGVEVVVHAVLSRACHACIVARGPTTRQRMRRSPTMPVPEIHKTEFR